MKRSDFIDFKDLKVQGKEVRGAVSRNSITSYKQNSDTMILIFIEDSDSIVSNLTIEEFEEILFDEK